MVGVICIRQFRVPSAQGTNWCRRLSRDAYFRMYASSLLQRNSNFLYKNVLVTQLKEKSQETRCSQQRSYLNATLFIRKLKSRLFVHRSRRIISDVGRNLREAVSASGTFAQDFIDERSGSTLATMRWFGCNIFDYPVSPYAFGETGYSECGSATVSRSRYRRQPRSSAPMMVSNIPRDRWDRDAASITQARNFASSWRACLTEILI